MEHKYTEPSEYNFKMLESRIMEINHPSNNTLINEMRSFIETLILSKEPTLVMATGGSKVVAYYLKSILENNDKEKIICDVIDIRDIFYKKNINLYKNLVIISRSGKSSGIDEAINIFKGNKYLISEHEVRSDIENIYWGFITREKSFISLSTSLGPMALILSSTISLEQYITKEEIENVNKIIKEYLHQAELITSKLKGTFTDAELIEIISGYDTLTSAYVLESNLVETGTVPVVVHDKGSYCHGRSNLRFQNPKSHIIFLSHHESELDNHILSILRREYDNIHEFTTYDLDLNYYYKEYYLTLNMYYLSKQIAEDKNIDLTQPEYNKNVVRKLYGYKGRM